MKKILLAFLVLVGIASISQAQTEVKQRKVSIDSATGKRTVTMDTIVKTEEEITPYTDMIDVNPLKFIFAYNLNWMHKLSENTALGIGLEFGTPQGYTAWGALGEFRFYPSKKSLHGFYVAPNISYVQTSNVSYGNYDPATSTYSQGYYIEQMFSAGILIGWQWFPGSNFSMGFALGVDDYIALNKMSGNHNDGDFPLIGGVNGTGASPALRFDIGYAW